MSKENKKVLLARPSPLRSTSPCYCGFTGRSELPSLRNKIRVSCYKTKLKTPLGSVTTIHQVPNLIRIPITGVLNSTAVGSGMLTVEGLKRTAETCTIPLQITCLLFCCFFVRKEIRLVCQAVSGFWKVNDC